SGPNTTVTEENAGELANSIMPPVEGEPDNLNETAEKNPPEEKPDTKRPETPDEEVEKPAPPEGDKEEGNGQSPSEEKGREENSENGENEKVTGEEAAVFQGEPKMEPVGPIEITPALSESVSQTQDTGQVEAEPEAEVENENSGEMIQAKFSSSHPEDPD